MRDGELDGSLLLPATERRALRVVVDSELRTPPEARVLAGAQPTLLAHREGVAAPDAPDGPAYLPLPAAATGLDLAALLDALAARECNEILLESGPSLAGAFLRAGLIDELLVYLAPRLLGSDARPLLDLPLTRMAEAMDLQLLEQRRVGEDLRLTFTPGASGDGGTVRKG